jgi:SAM-dependent methyltransferase
MCAALDARAHWNQIYREKSPDEVSWFEPMPQSSLELIDEAGIDRDAPVIVVGGGASRLAGELLASGYADITVADISGEAMALAKADLDERGDRITWVEVDLRDHDFGRSFELWHDRAVFHFMVDSQDRDGYLAALRRALAPSGQLIVATFGPEAPASCSGLPVHRYTAPELAAILPDFELASTRNEVHRTPGGKDQQFLYARFVRSSATTGNPSSRQA